MFILRTAGTFGPGDGVFTGEPSDKTGFEKIWLPFLSLSAQLLSELRPLRSCWHEASVYLKLYIVLCLALPLDRNL